jgi:isoleucyl-tRNA synthetase
LKIHAPFKEVIVTGFLVDEKGYKLSKSLGNYQSPLKMLDKFSPDGIRIWAARSAFGKNIVVNMTNLDQCTRIEKKIRNIFNFLLSYYDPNAKSFIKNATEPDK